MQYMKVQPLDPLNPSDLSVIKACIKGAPHKKDTQTIYPYAYDIETRWKVRPFTYDYYNIYVGKQVVASLK